MRAAVPQCKDGAQRTHAPYRYEFFVHVLVTDLHTARDRDCGGPLDTDIPGIGCPRCLAAALAGELMPPPADG